MLAYFFFSGMPNYILVGDWATNFHRLDCDELWACLLLARSCSLLSGEGSWAAGGISWVGPWVAAVSPVSTRPDGASRA